MLDYDREAVQAALELSWSLESAKQWTAQNPATGQCNVTAALVCSFFGGEILRTKVSGLHHYYNQIHGSVVDFTASQFSEPIMYENEPSSIEDALAGIARAEFDALGRAFIRHYKKS